MWSCYTADPVSMLGLATASCEALIQLNSVSYTATTTQPLWSHLSWYVQGQMAVNCLSRRGSVSILSLIMHTTIILKFICFTLSCYQEILFSLWIDYAQWTWSFWWVTHIPNFLDRGRALFSVQTESTGQQIIYLQYNCIHWFLFHIWQNFISDFTTSLKTRQISWLFVEVLEIFSFSTATLLRWRADST